MVSTRGGARTGADEKVEIELKWQNKPLRRAAATIKPTKAAPAAKTTHSKRTKPGDEDEEADELQSIDVVAAPKVTRKGQATKDDESKPAATSRARVTTTATTTTATKKAAATRTTKPSKIETATPNLSPPTQPKTARATRATASTRATAAKERAAPLSPKKITQVSKAPFRGAKNAKVKGTTVKEDKKAVTKSRPTTRQRGVSDENAGVPNLRPSTPNQEGQQEVKLYKGVDENCAAEKPSAKAVAVPEPIEIDDDAPMSTRSTTPADSPRLEPDEVDEDALQQVMSDAESDASAELEISADELCGPKTPMKRLSPRERFKYTSARKGRHVEDIPVNTPARRFRVLGSQGGTPQTQKPYCKPSLPMSEVRPTTVARARDRAMVFPKLQPLALPLELEEADEEVDYDNVPAPAGAERIALYPAKEDDEVDDDESSISELADVPEDAGSHPVTDGDSGKCDDIAIPFQMKDLTIENVADGEGDPNETILMDTRNSLDTPLDASLGSEEGVIVRHDMAAEPDEVFTCDESMEDVCLPTTTPKPETIVWENLREDVTIPFHFDSMLSGSRAGTLGELDQSLGVISDERVEAKQGLETEDHLELAQRTPDVEMDMTLADIQYQRHSFGEVRMSVDATVNLSDFLDMSSLTEQPGQELQVETNMNSDCVNMDILEANLDDEDLNLHDMTVASSPQHPQTPVRIPSTPARDNLPALPSMPQQEPRDALGPGTPHYAMPTIAFRRKSLPAVVYHTPMKNGARPKTSDGATMPRLSNPFTNMAAAEKKSQQGMSPFRRRLSMAQASGGMPRPQTPSTDTPVRMPSRKTPRTSGRAGVAQTPRTSSRLSARPTPGERFPGLPSRQTYEELTSTPTAKTPHKFTPSPAKSIMKECLPALPPAEKYELDKTPTSVHALKSASATPQTVQSTFSPIEDDSHEVQQEERYPGLPHRRTYEEHARTAIPASRFRTPSQSPAKRPATAQRPTSLRKIALGATTPNGSRTPAITPLRAPAMTPGQVPLTPHPGAPLKGVNAYVDVFLNDGSSANSTYIAVLQSLGAKTTKTFNDRVTHVVFKEGSPATLQRLRLHNKQVFDSAKGKEIFCVNGRWVNDSNSESARMDETDEAYAVDIEDQRASKRRRKSMEPTSLLNIGGNVVRDPSRKSSLGRSSFARALNSGSPQAESPPTAMSADVAEKENSGESSFGDQSPATPAYLAAPDSLVQQTAPMNRVSKLDFAAQEQAKNRRLTFWDGGEF